jgi:hypothetical protein
MKRIELHGKYGDGLFAIIDDEDYHLVQNYKWRLTSSGYAVAPTGSGDNIIFMHHLAMGVLRGTEVDHINLDRLLNIRSNLRIATHLQNTYNRGVYSNNKTGYKGVFYDLHYKKKYRAYISADKRRIYLGEYETATEAATAYNEAALKYHGKFAYFNKF